MSLFFVGELSHQFIFWFKVSTESVVYLHMRMNSSGGVTAAVASFAATLVSLFIGIGSFTGGIWPLLYS